MAGNRLGGLKAAAKNKAKDPDFYAKIGAKGGANGNTGGFAHDELCHCDYSKRAHKRAQCAGHKGGLISRRTKA